MSVTYCIIFLHTSYLLFIDSLDYNLSGRIVYLVLLLLIVIITVSENMCRTLPGTYS